RRVFHCHEIGITTPVAAYQYGVPHDFLDLYENGRVEARAELLNRINKLSLSERDIARRTELYRKPVHLFWSGKPVRRKGEQRKNSGELYFSFARNHCRSRLWSASWLKFL